MQGWPMLVLVLAAITCSAVTSLSTACFLLTYSFPLLNAQLGAAGTFWT